MKPMKTYNIIGKNNDMVITISGTDEDDAINEVNSCLLEGSYYFEEIKEVEQ
jgi:hypothetical protein